MSKKHKRTEHNNVISTPRKKRDKPAPKPKQIRGPGYRAFRYVYKSQTVANDTPHTAEARVGYVNTRYTGANRLDFRQRIAEGKDATTSLIGVRYTSKTAKGVYAGHQTLAPKFKYLMQGDLLANHISTYMPLSPASTSVVSKAKSSAQIKFAKEYKKQTEQNFAGGVFCGQLLQTIRELSRPAQGLRHGVRALYVDMRALYRERQRLDRYGRTWVRNKNSWRQLSHAVSDTWLEWRFGHSANIQDVDDAAQAIRALASGRAFDLIVMKAGGSAESGISHSMVNFNPHPSLLNNRAVVFGAKSEAASYTIRGAWRNENPSGQMPLPMRFGIGVLDVLPTAWELVPWSFFVDYFVNIGEVLDAWQMRFVKFAWLNGTTRSSTTVNLSNIVPTPYNGGYTTDSCFGGHAEISRYDVDRQTISNQWETDFMVRLPGIEKNSGKWLNIAALMTMGIKPHR